MVLVLASACDDSGSGAGRRDVIRHAADHDGHGNGSDHERYRRGRRRLVGRDGVGADGGGAAPPRRAPRLAHRRHRAQGPRHVNQRETGDVKFQPAAAAASGAGPSGRVSFSIREDTKDLAGEGFGFLRLVTRYDAELSHQGGRWRCDGATSTVVAGTTRQGPIDDVGKQEDATPLAQRNIETIQTVGRK